MKECIEMNSTQKKKISYMFKGIKPLVATASIMISLVLLLGSTFSWFTAVDQKNNKFKAKELEFSVPIVDIFNPDQPWGVENKKVTAENTGDFAAFVRIMALPTMIKDGQPLPAQIGNQINITDLNTSDWMYGGDGYYYYLNILSPGQTAPYLFTTVELSSATQADPAYIGAELNIEVKAESIWAYGDFETAWWNQVPTSAPLTLIDSALKNSLN